MKCPHCDGTGEIKPESRDIGTMVVALRKARGMTQQQFADQAGYSRGQIANIETNRSDMTISRLVKLAEAFGCDVKDLFP